MQAPSGFGVSNMVGRLRKVALRRPGAILSADPDRWHYAKPIDAAALVEQYERFVELVAAARAEIVWVDPEGSDGGADDLADSVFTYDPSFVVPGGAVLLRPGKPLRRPEVAVHERFYRSIDMPVLGRIEAPGVVEGGDCFWLDDRTLAVGRGFRTDQAGIDQLATILAPEGIALDVYDLPYHLGPEACLHLLSVISPVAERMALVHPPLMPTALHRSLLDRGWQLIEAPAEEFETSLGLNLNVLATAPGVAIAVDGFPETLARLRAAGCEIQTFRADELCIPCEGGPTCLTRPLLRDPIDG